jgi:hypothetical protein
MELLFPLQGIRLHLNPSLGHTKGALAEANPGQSRLSSSRHIQRVHLLASLYSTVLNPHLSPPSSLLPAVKLSHVTRDPES